MKKPITNTHIEKILDLPTPETLKNQFNHTEKTKELISDSRKTIENIIDGTDSRPLIIVGPCSIHDPQAAIEYAKKLYTLHEKCKEKCYIVMRVYFEKPRTTMGWKGLINDPNMDQSFDIKQGLEQARHLLLQILDIGLPTASEMLDPIVPQYIADLVSWASLGARTTESQPHREMASGLSMPIGFKNATNGDVSIAINAMEAAKHSHSFIGTTPEGKVAYVKTKGNPYGHLILRGGSNGPNYDKETIEKNSAILNKKKLPNKILIDCSHGNSKKDHRNQHIAFENILAQRKRNPNILGAMLESNLFEDNQSIPSTLTDLKYGISVTDKCIGWEETKKLLTTHFST